MAIHQSRIMAAAVVPTVINNKKYINKAQIPIIFFISSFENIRKPHNAKGKPDTPNKIIVLKNISFKGYDANTPGKSIAHPIKSNFAIKDSKRSKAYKRIPNNAPAKGRGKPNNFDSGSPFFALLFCGCFIHVYIFQTYQNFDVNPVCLNISATCSCGAD